MRRCVSLGGVWLSSNTCSSVKQPGSRDSCTHRGIGFSKAGDAGFLPTDGTHQACTPASSPAASNQASNACECTTHAHPGRCREARPLVALGVAGCTDCADRKAQQHMVNINVHPQQLFCGSSRIHTALATCLRSTGRLWVLTGLRWDRRSAH